MEGAKTQSWAVTVERNGESVVTIASNCHGGLNISKEDAPIIRLAAQHLRMMAEIGRQRERAERAEAQRDEYKALAAVGTWHNDCRPNRHKAAQELQKSQAVIDKLADRITELEAALSEAQQTRETSR